MHLLAARHHFRRCVFVGLNIFRVITRTEDYLLLSVKACRRDFDFVCCSGIHFPSGAHRTWLCSFLEAMKDVFLATLQNPFDSVAMTMRMSICIAAMIYTKCVW